MAGSKRQAAADRLMASYRHELAIMVENTRAAPLSADAKSRVQNLAVPGAVQATWAIRFWRTTPVTTIATALVERAAHHGVTNLRWYEPSDLVQTAQVLAAHRGLSVPDWLELLATNSDEADAFAEVLTVPNSAFFRRGLGAEVDPFAALASRWLPELARAHPERPLRIWSAGIGRGEEVWTLAILAAELEAAGYPGAEILGTDLRPTRIAVAREGRYPLSPALDHVSKARLAAHFVAESTDRYRVAYDLRRRVTFARHDLTAEPFAGPTGAETFDLISCRHVLMFFTAEARRRALAGLAGQLEDGGLLVLDQTAPDLLSGLVLVDRQARIWRKA